MSTAAEIHALREALSRALGGVVTLERVSGGDINEAFAATLRGGERVFVKTRSGAPRATFTVEAAGLDWLRAAGALRVPRVLVAHEDPPFLCLEWITSGPRSATWDHTLGEGLAALHASGAPTFGLDHDTFLGPFSMSNTPSPDWASFYAERRLRPELARARERLSVSAVRAVECVVEALPTLVGEAEAPSRLHGDLWSGNVMADERGAPVLIDPAVYGGHREIDLAMLTLFGHPSPRFFDAYDLVFPRAPGKDARVALYQLLPLLVHVSLFGGGYVRAVEDAAERALRGE